MSTETVAPVAGEKPVDTVMDQEAETKKDENLEVEVTDENKNTDESNEEDSKLALTIKKVREERDAQKALVKEKQTEVQNALDEVETLKNQLKLKEEEEAAARGNYEELYNTKVTELAELNSKFKELNNTKKTIETELQEKVENSDNLVNEMVDSLIAEWPETGKAAIDSRDEATASERFKQYKKTLPLVSEAQKKTESMNPGVGETPSSAVNGESNKNSSSYASMRKSGIYNG